MQWSGIFEYSSAARNYSQAEELINLLEVNDCGSIGGFDKGQTEPRNLFDRWDGLCRKYHDPEKLKLDLSYSEIKAFFQTGNNPYHRGG